MRTPLTAEENARRARALAQNAGQQFVNGNAGSNVASAGNVSSNPAEEIGIPPYVLPPHLAKQYSEFADAVRVAAPSEKLSAFTTCARYVFGLGKDDDFPLQEKVDRLQATAEAHGLFVTHDVDEIQARLAAARADPLVFDENMPRLLPEERAKLRGDRELIIRRASEIAPEPILWLWPGRVAVGKQTLIAGEPGLGKSQLSIAIIATVTVGGIWPGSQDRAPLGRAIILSAEDDAADTIIPRLIAAGADLSRVDIISAVRNETGARRTFNLQADLALLERHIEASKDVRVVKIDPISSYMGTVDSHKNTDVRGVLEAVGEMAARHRVAVVGITHFSKGAGQRAINAFIGSIAFIAAARAAFAVMKDPDDDSRRLFLPVKNNLAPLGLGLAFRLAQHLVSTANGDTVASAVAWEDTPVTNTADGVMAASAGTSTPHTAKADCIEFLETVLANGWTSTADIAAEAVSAGLHAEGKQLRDNKPLRDARTALKVEIRREGFGKGASYFWALPGTPWVPSGPMGDLPHERARMGEEGHA